MKLNSKSISFAVAMFCGAGVWAADGTVNVTGSVSATTCTVNGNGTGVANFSIAMPNVAKSALNVAGATAGTTPFTIAVTGCSGTSTTITPYFESGSTINSSGRLINSGTAANVEVQITTGTGTVVALNAGSGSQNVTATNLSGGAGTSSFIARYYATGVATAGTVSSSFTYSIVYN